MIFHVLLAEMRGLLQGGRGVIESDVPHGRTPVPHVKNFQKSMYPLRPLGPIEHRCGEMRGKPSGKPDDENPKASCGESKHHLVMLHSLPALDEPKIPDHAVMSAAHSS